MKQTIKEGNERRKYGGLFCSWKILVCDGVAGNKAPKESDLRMTVKEAKPTLYEENQSFSSCIFILKVPIDQIENVFVALEKNVSRYIS